MNKFQIIPETETLRASLPKLMDNDRTAMTCSSGTESPSADAGNIGRLFLNTKTNLLYQCYLNSAGNHVWTEIADLTKTVVYTDSKNLFATSGHTHASYARTDQAETFSNSLTVSSNLTVKGAIIQGSDVRIKHDITPIKDGLAVINQLNGMQYTLNSNLQRQYGVIAQDVQAVAPTCVHTLDDKNQTLAVNYNGLVAILIEAVKTLTEKVDKLEKLVI